MHHHDNHRILRVFLNTRVLRGFKHRDGLFLDRQSEKATAEKRRARAKLEEKRMCEFTR